MNSVRRSNTLRGHPVVIAPGKLFLVGEYAVLEGAPAVIAAVDRYASAQFLPGTEPQSPVVVEAVEAACRELAEKADALPQGSVLVDTSQLMSTTGNRKLGLGSSAATAVASAGAVFETVGVSVADSKYRLFNAADLAHRAAQKGAGSGADIAAAVFGGVLRFVRRPGAATADIEPLPILPGISLVVFATDAAASTPSMIEAVRQLAQRNPHRYSSLLESMREHARNFIAALRNSQPALAVTTAGAYGDVMAELGAAAGIPIVTPAHQQARELAVRHGGAAKPSGAGGGDIGIALFAEQGAAAAFAAEIGKLNLSVVPVAIDRLGVRRQVKMVPF